jgi:hypothetical protein
MKNGKQAFFLFFVAQGLHNRESTRTFASALVKLNSLAPFTRAQKFALVHIYCQLLGRGEVKIATTWFGSSVG